VGGTADPHSGTPWRADTLQLAFSGAKGIGHAGAGGSRHGAWPCSRVGFSYAMNRTRAAWPERRPLDLLAAPHDAVRH
jgi:hypothetical protein